MRTYKKAVLTTALLSLSLGGVNVCMILKSAERVYPGSGGYAVLSFAAEYPEEAVLEALTAAGIAPVIAESTQWVYLDELGEVARVPLRSFSERLEDFDPRNDGYARRLRAFFVRDGKRYLYLPPQAGLEKRIAFSLGELPFTLELPQRPLEWYFLIFAAASAGSIVLGGVLRSTALSVPPAAGLFLAGAPGFAMAAALFGAAGLLQPPLRELLVSRQPGAFRRQWTRFRFSWLRAALCGGLYGVMWRWSGLSSRAGLLVFLSFCGVFAASLRLELRQGHVRFLPVPIRPAGRRVFLFPRCMAPFTLASLFVLFALPSILRSQKTGESSLEPALLISAGEYEAHVAFQFGFSYRPLGSGLDRAVLPAVLPAETGSGRYYQRYVQGTDGLIEAERGERGIETGLGTDAPPFPLSELMAFLNGVDEKPPRGERFFVALMGIGGLPALIPHFRRRGKTGALLITTDKRIAA